MPAANSNDEIAMRLITRESDYGITALVSLAKRKGGTTSTAELAKELQIPRSFLRRILQRLVRCGAIRSRKGIGGGFELARKPQHISVGDVVIALQGAIRFSDCGIRKTICPRRKQCILRRKLRAAEGHLISELMGLSIESLAK